MTQKTAVEWLQEQLECFGNKHELQMSWATVDSLLEQAKEMEKQQIVSAWANGWVNGDINENRYEYMAQEYYNKTFKSKQDER